MADPEVSLLLASGCSGSCGTGSDGSVFVCIPWQPGARTEADAQAAVKQLNRSFFDTSKISALVRSLALHSPTVSKADLSEVPAHCDVGSGR